MWNNGDELKEQLINLEKLKVSLMKQINILNENKKSVYPTRVYPISDTVLTEVNNYPVLRFSYDGLLPLYIENDNYKQIISDYYFQATISSYDFEGLQGIFDKVFIIYCHFFNDHQLKDLDNRNKKYIQDAIRHTRVLSEDNWELVSNVDVGFLDDRNHVDVFVVRKENAIDLLDRLVNDIDTYKSLKPAIEKEEFVRKYKKEDYVVENTTKKRLIGEEDNSGFWDKL